MKKAASKRPAKKSRAKRKTQRLSAARTKPFHKMSFKELLSNAPLEGVNLTRPKDYGREIDLD
jgi:hypothetical protein